MKKEKKNLIKKVASLVTAGVLLLGAGAVTGAKLFPDTITETIEVPYETFVEKIAELVNYVDGSQPLTFVIG
jgi:hypothetical protein